MNILIDIREGRLFFHVKLDDGGEESGFAPEGLSRVLGAIRNTVLKRILERHFTETHERYVRSLADRQIYIEEKDGKLSCEVDTATTGGGFHTGNLGRLADFIDRQGGNPEPSGTSRNPSLS